MEWLLAAPAAFVAEMPKPRPEYVPGLMLEFEKSLRQQVALRLKQTRVLIDTNRTRLAEKYGIHHTVWQKWEEGRAFPSEVVMVRFCDDHGVTMDWIYRGVMTGLPQYLITMLVNIYPEYFSGPTPPPRAEDGAHDLLPGEAPEEPRPARRRTGGPLIPREDPPPPPPPSLRRRGRKKTGAC